MSGGHCAPMHDGGSVLGSWPGHRMQVCMPHPPPPHCVFCTQRLHGSSPVLSTPSGPLLVMFMLLHAGDTAGLRMMLRHELGSVGIWQTVQQPKQSQPGGD